MAKFKVGDKVRVRSDLNGNDRYYNEDKNTWDDCVSEMVDLRGKTVTIKEVGATGKYSICEEGYSWTDEMFAEPRREFILIRRSGAETIAELRHDREVIKSAKATCAPSDTFDLETGAKLAFDRLMGREEPKPAQKPDPYAKYFTHSKDFESRSKFKIGDLVIRDGKTKTVVGHERDLSNWVWTLDDRDSRPYPNLEHFLSPVPAPEPPKFYTGKVFCSGTLVNKMRIPERDGHIFNVVNGVILDADDRFGLGSSAFAPYESFSDLCKRLYGSEWREVKE